MAGPEPEELPGWTAGDELNARRDGLGAGLLRALRGHALLAVPLAFWVTASIRAGAPYRWVDGLGFLLAGLWLTWFVGLAIPMVLYERCLQATTWHEWASLRRTVRLFRVLGWWAARNPAVRSDLDFRLAFACAAQGRWAEAERIIQPYRDPAVMSEALFWSRYSTMCDFAGRHDETILARRRVTELSPGTSSSWIDLALSLSKDARDPAGARSCLDQARQCEVTETGKPFAEHVEGLLALHEGRPADARSHWERAIPAIETQGNNPVVLEFVAVMKAHLSIAYAQLGAAKPAQYLFAAVRPLLEAQNDALLLRRCQAALAGRPR